MAAAYQLTATNEMVIRTADNFHIPNQPLNRDWATYQAWLTAGGVPDPYVAVPLSLITQTQNYLAAGLTITSTGKPTANGTYMADVSHNLNVNSISTAYYMTNKFPDSASTVPIFDTAGASHAMDLKTFTNYVTALRDFVHHCRLYSLGIDSALPPNHVTIP